MRQDVCNLLDESFQSHRFRYVYPLRHVLGETGSGIRPSYLACYMYYSSMVLTLLELQSRFGDNWGHITWNVSALSPKRDWSSKGVKNGTNSNRYLENSTIKGSDRYRVSKNGKVCL